MKSDWEKEFNDKYRCFTWWVNNETPVEVEIPPELKDFIRSLLRQARQEGIEEATKKMLSEEEIMPVLPSPSMGTVIEGGNKPVKPELKKKEGK